jgi:hypothetical protein
MQTQKNFLGEQAKAKQEEEYVIDLTIKPRDNDTKHRRCAVKTA